jgi:hypothetical protein
VRVPTVKCFDGKQQFFGEIKKLPVPQSLFLQYLPLWDGMELAVAFQNEAFKIDPEVNSNNLIMEGLQCYGGTACRIIRFTKAEAVAFEDVVKEKQNKAILTDVDI